MLMTAADVAAIAKPWELQHETAKQVADEFFDQGIVVMNISWIVEMIKRGHKLHFKCRLFEPTCGEGFLMNGMSLSIFFCIYKMTLKIVLQQLT